MQNVKVSQQMWNKTGLDLHPKLREKQIRQNCSFFKDCIEYEEKENLKNNLKNFYEVMWYENPAVILENTAKLHQEYARSK